MLMGASVCYFSQNNEEVKLDLLKSPSSPAFILLNQQPTDIERPATPTDFAVSFRNSSNNFSAFPKNYAVEMAPAWLFNAKNIGFEAAYGEHSHEDYWKNIQQTFNLSVAYAPVDSLVPQGASQFGFGFKFSIVRGQTDTAFLNTIKSLNGVLKEIGQDFTAKAEAELRKNRRYFELDSFLNAKLKNGVSATDTFLIRSLSITMEKLENEIKNNFIKDYSNKLEAKRLVLIEKLKKMQVMRTGFFLDVAGGAVLDFPTRVFEYSEINKYGAWITSGVDGKNISALGIGRLLANTKTPYLTDSSLIGTDNSTALDLGGRLIYKKDKFNISVEALYRNYLNTDKYQTGWKGTFYISYDLGTNKLLTLNISRDFNGSVNKKGNLVTALNLIIGLGSTRNTGEVKK